MAGNASCRFPESEEENEPLKFTSRDNRRVKRLPGRTKLVIVTLTLGALSLWMSYPVWGHGILSQTIEHHIQIAVGSSNIDVEVELIFHGEYAGSQRQRMDRDHDGRISGRELAAYLVDRTPDLEKGVLLTADDHPLNTIPLHNPGLDLMGNYEAGSHPFKLRVFYFARTPQWLAAGDIVAIEDRLWSDSSAFCSHVATGREGVRLTAISNTTPLREDFQSRVFRFLYTPGSEET